MDTSLLMSGVCFFIWITKENSIFLPLCHGPLSLLRSCKHMHSWFLGFGPSDHHIPVPRPHTPTEESQPPDILEILDTSSKIFVAELDEWQDVRPGISGKCGGVRVNIEVWEDGSDGCWNE